MYFHHTKLGFKGDQNNNDDLLAFHEDADKLAQEELKKKIKKPFAELKTIWDDAHYVEDGEENVNALRMDDYNRKYFDFVVNVLKSIIAKNYDFKIDRYTAGILPFPELKEALAKEVAGHFLQYDAYFHKVNFLFAYFENKGKMINQWFAFVDKKDVDDIISKCEEILEAEKLGDKKIKKPFAELKAIWDDAHYVEDDEENVNALRMYDYNRKYFDFVVNVLKPIIAKNYDFKIDRYTAGILPFPELKEALAKEVAGQYLQYVDIDGGETAKSLAAELLPTRDGFFFGDTDYDDRYFQNVKDCLRQMKSYRKLLKDGVTGFVVFS